MGVINLDIISYEGDNDNVMTVYTSNVANTNQIATDFVKNISFYK